MKELRNVNRLVVIDEQGKQYEANNQELSFVFQDKARTLKIFVTQRTEDYSPR